MEKLFEMLKGQALMSSDWRQFAFGFATALLATWLI